MIDEALLENFIALILTHTGIHIRSQDKSLLEKKLGDRSRALAYSRLSSYYALLANGGDRDSQKEWKILASMITTGESYFFRDQGQITLLQERILPELIAAHGEDRRLNILSAGCSSGEEVYSLAILLKELIPYIYNWHISLVGLDLNQEAIAKAKDGLYGEWSFRGVDPARRSPRFCQNCPGIFPYPFSAHSILG